MNLCALCCTFCFPFSVLLFSPQKTRFPSKYTHTRTHTGTNLTIWIIANLNAIALTVKCKQDQVNFWLIALLTLNTSCCYLNKIYFAFFIFILFRLCCCWNFEAENLACCHSCCCCCCWLSLVWYVLVFHLSALRALLIMWKHFLWKKIRWQCLKSSIVVDDKHNIMACTTI